MFLSSAHKALDSDDRCVYDPQQPLAGQESQPPQQARHDPCHLVNTTLTKYYNN
jgi:hypothetical protein